MAFKKRVERRQTVPAEPILPSVEVARKGAIKYEIKLTPDKGYPYRTLFGNVKHGYYWDGEPVWYVYGTRRHAEAVGQRILNRYMRRLGYQKAPATRFIGKEN